MKSNKKRILFVLAILTMAIVLSCALVACDKAGTNKTGTDIVADYKVTIHPNNGQGDIVWDITKEIPTITKDGYHIAGYFLDAQLTISTTLESLKATGITKNIDVYVKWEEDVCEHVEVTDAAVAPTCTEKGLTEGKHCSKCGKILKAQTEIDALGHDLENHDGQEATCTEKGWKEYVTCKREGCKHTTYEEIPALGHKYGDLISKIEPTCSATGTEAHYKCSVCNKVFKDDEHKTETTLADLTIAINPNAHNFGEWIKNEGADTHTRVCSFNNEHAETENCHGGTATCTEQAVCEKCNAKYGKALGHDYQGGVCTRCGTERASEGLEYSLNSDETGYTVTGIGSCTDTEIVIPSKHNSKPVTSIGYQAFYNCSGLTSVTIPNSVTSIGDSAFEGCSGLTSITIPDSVTKISSWTFEDCSGLTSITIPDSVTSIGRGAFRGCMKLKDIYITDIVTWCNISGLDNLMGNSSNNKNLYINNELVTAVTIQDGITAISASAFRNCSGLTSITIGDSVTSIGVHAFAGCIGLVNISVADGNTKYHSSGNCLIETASNTLVLGCKTSVIPSDGSVTSIGEGAFFCCDELTSVTIPDGVTRIGNYAFAGCIELTSVTIPNSVTSIDNDAFFGCSRLKSIIFNGTIAQWNAVSKGNYWKLDVPRTCKVVCTDGTISI